MCICVYIHMCIRVYVCMCMHVCVYMCIWAVFRNLSTKTVTSVAKNQNGLKRLICKFAQCLCCTVSEKIERKTKYSALFKQIK